MVLVARRLVEFFLRGVELFNVGELCEPSWLLGDRLDQSRTTRQKKKRAAVPGTAALLGMLLLQSPQPGSGPSRKNVVRTLELVERDLVVQSGLLFEFLGAQLAAFLYRL